MGPVRSVEMVGRGVQESPRPGERVERHVLVVDDEGAICRVLDRYLTKQGFVVESASSAGAALILLHRMRFSVMISDVRLPDGSGLELVRQARAIDAQLAIIIFSGEGDEATHQTALDNGASEFLTKPVPLPEFGMAVRRAEARRIAAIA